MTTTTTTATPNIKPSLVCYLRSQMEHMRVAGRTVLETDAGQIVEYEVWFMEATSILRAFVQVVEDESTPYQVPSKDLPLDKLVAFLNNQLP